MRKNIPLSSHARNRSDFANQPTQRQSKQLAVLTSKLNKSLDINQKLRHFELIFDRAGDGLLIMDRQCIVLRANAVAAEMLHQVPSRIVNKPMGLFLNSSDNMQLANIVVRLVSLEQRKLTMDAKLVGVHKSSDVRLTVSRFDNNGDTLIVNLHDISELTAVLNEKQQQETLTALAGTTAHKLNQPLTAVLGYVHLLKRSHPDLSEIATVDKIEKAANEIAALVREIGKITRFQTEHYAGNNKILVLDNEHP